MLIQQIFVFLMYVVWFAGPFVIATYVTRSMSKMQYLKNLILGLSVIVLVCYCGAILISDLFVSVMVVAGMNWVTFVSAQRLNELHIPRTRVLWVLTGFGLLLVPIYCLFAVAQPAIDHST